MPSPPSDDLMLELRGARTALEKADLLVQSLGGHHVTSVVSAVQDTMGNVEIWEQTELMRAGPWLRPHYPTARANDPSAIVAVCVLRMERPLTKSPPPPAGQPFPGYRFALYYVFDDGTVWTRVLTTSPPPTAGPSTAK